MANLNLALMTNLLILFTFIAWILFDVFLASHGGPTESMIIRDHGKISTFFPHLWGFLMGHWFWPRQSQWVSGWMYGLVFWGILITWDLWWYFTHRGEYPWYRYEGFWLLVGVISGTVFWTQVHKGSPIP